MEEGEVRAPLCQPLRVYWDGLDEVHPFEDLALKCLKNPFVGPFSGRTGGLQRIVEEYQINGALLLVLGTPAYQHENGASKMPKDFLERFGAPFLVLEKDLSDPRGFPLHKSGVVWKDSSRGPGQRAA